MTTRIKELKDENTAVFDLNHPHAGKTLHFGINIIEVRGVLLKRCPSRPPDVTVVLKRGVIPDHVVSITVFRH
jgi:hypothetical protein